MGEWPDFAKTSGVHTLYTTWCDFYIGEIERRARLRCYGNRKIFMWYAEVTPLVFELHYFSIFVGQCG